MAETLHVIPPKSIPPLAVDLNQAARLIGLSTRTVRDMANDGRLPSVQPGGKGGKLLFRIVTIDAWLAEQESKSSRAAVEGGSA